LEEKIRIQVTLDSIADGVVTTDRKGNIEYMNPVAEEITGWTCEAAKGLPIESVVILLDENTRKTVPSMIRQSMIVGKELDRSQVRLLTNKHGKEYAISESAAPIRNVRNKIVRSVLVMHDETQTRRLHQQLSYQSYQSGLVEMSATIMHNIGNAINSIAVRTSSLQKDIKELQTIASILELRSAKAIEDLQAGSLRDNDAELRLLFDIFQEAGNSLSRLISAQLQPKTDVIDKGVERIVDVVRLQQKVTAPIATHAEFNLKHAIQDAFTILQEDLNKSNITFEIRLDEAVPVVNLPRNQLIQSILHLINNAMEAIIARQPQDAVDGKIQVIGVLSSDRKFIELEFADNGCGILQDQIDHIFQYGYSSKKSGAGFGLHSVATFIQSQLGEIKAYSAGLNQGAQILIRLPILPVAPAEI